MELLKLYERRFFKINPRLERMQDAIKELGIDPQNLPPVVLIGGTNGKGSTAGFLWRMLSVSGLRCGLYTSPHLLSFEERIQLSHRDVSMEFLEEEYKEMLCKLSPFVSETLTFFEATTLLAFSIFKKTECECWVIEVGLGGRWDATNVLEPDISAIVSVDYDHKEWLGETLEKIAREKLGITRPSAPLFWGERRLWDVFDKALQEGAQTDVIYRAGRHFNCELSSGMASLDLPFISKLDFDLPMPLESFPEIMKSNFVLSYAMYTWLVSQKFSKLPALDRSLLFQKLFSKEGRWPNSFLGRMQSLEVQGAKKNWTLHLDVCHNEASVKECVKNLEAAGIAKRNEIKIPGFVSILCDKEQEKLVSLLSQVLEPLILFKIPNERSITDLQIRSFANNKISCYADFSSLWHAIAETINSPVLVCGSFYAVANVLKYFKAFPKSFSGQRVLQATDPRSDRGSLQSLALS